jgi:hypothetical protein
MREPFGHYTTIMRLLKVSHICNRAANNIWYYTSPRRFEAFMMLWEFVR